MKKLFFVLFFVAVDLFAQTPTPLSGWNAGATMVPYNAPTPFQDPTYGECKPPTKDELIALTITMREIEKVQNSFCCDLVTHSYEEVGRIRDQYESVKGDWACAVDAYVRAKAKEKK